MRVKQMERIRIKCKNLINISKIRGRMSPPIPLVMRIVILFDWRMEFFWCFIGPKNSHPKINWKVNHFQFSLAVKGWRGHWLEGRISKLSLDKGNKLKEGSWEAYQVGGWCVFFWPKRRKEEKECVKEDINSYVWRKVVHGKNVCKQRAWKEVVCSK